MREGITERVVVGSPDRINPRHKHNGRVSKPLHLSVSSHVTLVATLNLIVAESIPIEESAKLVTQKEDFAATQHFRPKKSSSRS